MSRPLSTLTLLVAATLAIVACPRPGAAQALQTPAERTNDPMVDSPWFKLGWPKVSMPELSWKPWGNDAAPDAAPGGNPVAETLDRVSSASGRAASAVRDGWGSMLSKLPFGPGSAPPGTNAGRNEPGFFSRMFGPQEPQGAQTVAEFLAQERPSQVR